MDMTTLKTGDRVYRWVWVGMGDRNDIQELTVQRVNRKTVTVDTDQGSRMRIKHGDIAGRVDW